MVGERAGGLKRGEVVFEKRRLVAGVDGFDGFVGSSGSDGFDGFDGFDGLVASNGVDRSSNDDGAACFVDL